MILSATVRLAGTDGCAVGDLAGSWTHEPSKSRAGFDGLKGYMHTPSGKEGVFPVIQVCTWPSVCRSERVHQLQSHEQAMHLLSTNPGRAISSEKSSVTWAPSREGAPGAPKQDPKTERTIKISGGQSMPPKVLTRSGIRLTKEMIR